MITQFPFPRRASVLAAFAAVALVLVPTASSGTYSDPAGDGHGAGDVTGVTVSADKSNGQIMFRIVGSNMGSSETNLLSLFIDSDANPQTGSFIFDGADYWFGVDNDSYWFVHWNGVDWVRTSGSTVRVFGGPSELVISVNRSELGNTGDLNFVASTLDLNNLGSDDAPDDGAFNFSLEANGPQIDTVDVTTVPSAGPKRGKKFTITPAGLHLPPDGRTNGTLPAPESYSCSSAKLGARTLVGSGTGSCTFSIPKKKAKGKRLTLVLTVNYQGTAKPVPLTFKVG
jgi:hypothetical protein